MSDIEMLETQVRTLEKDLRLAQQTLKDQYAMAALTGIMGNSTAWSLSLRQAVESAFDVAEVAMEVRKCRL